VDTDIGATTGVGRQIGAIACIVFGFLFPSLSAIAQNNESLGVPDASFDKLAYLGNLLDQPTDLDSLKACTSQNDKPCIGLFRSERAAVRAIFSNGRAAALTATLTAIKQNCSSSDTTALDRFPWRACNGAVATLFFFHSEEEDHQIFEFFRHLDRTILETILISSHSCSDWVRNRPDHQKWAEFIKSLAFLDNAPGGRSGYERIFLDSFHPTTGIALLDPENRDAAAIQLPN
jgi:hypothetical protein